VRSAAELKTLALQAIGEVVDALAAGDLDQALFAARSVVGALRLLKARIRRKDWPS
jgi:hypothetical protein